MFNVATRECETLCFKKLSERGGKTCFFRYIGYTDESKHLNFLAKYYAETCKRGMYISKGVQNPSEAEVSSFMQMVASLFDYSVQAIAFDMRRWMPELTVEVAKHFAQSMEEMLTWLSKKGMNANIIKNTYIKLMCWSKYDFGKAVRGLGADNPPKVLYVGDISKYEVYMLRLLSRSGCDVLYVNYFSDDSYKKADPALEFSGLVQGQTGREPSKDFTKIDPEEEARKEAAARQIEAKRATAVREMTAIRGVINTNSWLDEDFFAAIGKTNSQRGSSEKLNNLFVRYIGVDDHDSYMNRLFALKKGLSDGDKKFVLEQMRLPPPDNAEIAEVTMPSSMDSETLLIELANQIRLHTNRVLDAAAKNAFFTVMSERGETNISKLKSYAVHMLCWMRRYTHVLFDGVESLPVFIYYGRCVEREWVFMQMLALMGADVIYICTDHAGDFECTRSKRIMLPVSVDVPPFPSTEIRVRATTAAYQAERELDQTLYTGTGLFRHRQFTRSEPITLKTTIDEVQILWSEESKYRPSFEANNGRVVVPNIFAKVCGVKEGDVSAYFSYVRSLVTENSVLIKEIPHIHPHAPNNLRSVSESFVRNGEIKPDLIKRHSDYRYDHLSEDLQDYILEKLQKFLDLKWIKDQGHAEEVTAVSVVLNMELEILRLIQNFDFTRSIPKLIVVNVDESMMSLEDCILIAYLNLVGFDIVIFTPTGYRNLEKYIKDDVFEQYVIGEYKFGLKVPNLSPMKIQERAKFLNKLFGKK